MRAFHTYHPVVNFTFFVATIGFSMVLMHPVCLAISLFCSTATALLFSTKKATRFRLFSILPLCIFSALLSPAFSHAGVTILAYLPGGNPLTRESVIYGIATACMLWNVMHWFACFHGVMHSDKLMYLFGKITPALSLVFSMVLRFVPKCSAYVGAVFKARRGLYGKSDGMRQKLNDGMQVLSATVSWSLEHSIETADSMKSRGYGLGHRTAFSNYRFCGRDSLALSVIFVFSLFILAGWIRGSIAFQYFPFIYAPAEGMERIWVFTAYFLLCMMPLFLEGWEAYTWKRSVSKI